MRFITTLLLVFYVGIIFSQIREFQVVLIDQLSKEPIVDAHVFIGNSIFGTISDKNGGCKFSFPSDVTTDILIFHVSYEAQVLQFSEYSAMQAMDTIFIKPSGVDLDEVVIAGPLAKKWKKNYRKFSKAFIGAGRRASLYELKNPEVLRFSNEDGIFKATAIDMLKIKNHYLGYDINFLLRELNIDKDGSMKYFGYSKFTDRSLKTNEVEINKNRKEAHKKSKNHFFLNLITDNLKEAEYKIALKRYTGSEFVEMGSPEVSELIKLDTLSGMHHIVFDDFLEVKHLGIKQINDGSNGLSLGNQKRTKFGNIQDSESGRITIATSMLYKDSPSLIINKYGQILNEKDVQEFGYWAEQRISNLLPFDYGFETVIDRDTMEKGILSKVDTTPIIPLDTSTLLIVHDLLYGTKEKREEILDYIDDNWKDAYVPILIDINRVVTSVDINPRVIELLGNKAGIYDYYSGLAWMWSGDEIYDENYADAKAEIYQHIDPIFKSYFIGQQNTAKISIDEIVWGGVKQDGIPPLRRPKMMSLAEAEYLDEEDIVFGIVINGEAKAYPKRILSWHELFIDKIGEENVVGVYCILCGTMIAYDMKHRNDIHDLNTSGFLYRSNKLLFDKKTGSLWSTIDGEPVLGPLAGRGIKLKTYPVVTTTWKQWIAKHPESKVLDIETGFLRDYGEGEAYKEYFSHDRLMFPVPLEDYSIKNKEEVLIIRSPRYETDPLAISIKYLKKKRLHHDEVADKKVIVISEKDGMSRVYYSKNVIFDSYKKGVLKDKKGNIWEVKDEGLTSTKGRKLLRAPAHNSFWFAWYNMYPDTRLVTK